ncbi:hypothetical protein A1O7_06939 [Cladophialophora yegresii CBS 114405]|uniref:Mid2 domain-containing protein n=1 Tax=Cladophialophora yegresii CBS 114405 TaxID=1182544 RepID=W9VUA0_9EURO|nr:uncharacterized protein A1O7_06939 [Cladophialophora yegresii CBS 114405]EXJ56595.1 hypothetical protein A1O7_06939 [Cladophialophora yegresii CBS 114405]
MSSLNACEACIDRYQGSSTTNATYSILSFYVNWCAEQGLAEPTASVDPEQISSYTASVGSSYAWCAGYLLVSSSVASNCSTSNPPTTSTTSASISSSSSTAPSTSTSTTASPPRATSSQPDSTLGAAAAPTPAADHSNTAAIAGGVVGGVGGAAVVIIVVWFLLRRRRKKPAALQDDQAAHEKAQLHSDDMKPDRKELEGTPASQALLEKRPTAISELPANGEVADNARLKEMPSNEPAGHEMDHRE